MAVKNSQAVLRFKPDVPPPEHLSEAAKSSWSQITRDYAMGDDRVGLGLLATALTAWDRAEEARRRIKREGLLIKNKDREYRPHPLLAVEARFMAEYRHAGTDHQIEANTGHLERATGLVIDPGVSF